MYKYCKNCGSYLVNREDFCDFQCALAWNVKQVHEEMSEDYKRESQGDSVVTKQFIDSLWKDAGKNI